MSRMAGVGDRIYLADSKTTVRRKLGLNEEQNEEDFSKFEVDLSCTKVRPQD